MRELLRLGADICSLDNELSSPLHFAARNDLSIVKLLLERGANVNALSVARRNCLFEAVDFHKLDIMHYLLRQGADYQVLAGSAGSSQNVYQLARARGWMDVMNELAQFLSEQEQQQKRRWKMVRNTTLVFATVLVGVIISRYLQK